MGPFQFAFSTELFPLHSRVEQDHPEKTKSDTSQLESRAVTLFEPRQIVHKHCKELLNRRNKMRELPWPTSDAFFARLDLGEAIIDLQFTIALKRERDGWSTSRM